MQTPPILHVPEKDKILNILRLLGFQFEEDQILAHPDMAITFASVGTQGDLNLIGPLSGEALFELVQDGEGPPLHHICFQVRDLRAKAKVLNEAGIPLMFHRHQESEESVVNFIHPRYSGGILIELSEKS